METVVFQNPRAIHSHLRCGFERPQIRIVAGLGEQDRETIHEMGSLTTQYRYGSSHSADDTPRTAALASVQHHHFRCSAQPRLALLPGHPTEIPASQSVPHNRQKLNGVHQESHGPMTRSPVSQVLVIIKQGIPAPPRGDSLTKYLAQPSPTEQVHQHVLARP